MNTQTERDEFFYNAGLFSAKHGVNCAPESWCRVWQQSKHLCRLDEMLCNGKDFVPAHFTTSYTGEDREFAYLEYLEGKLATLIRKLLPVPGVVVHFTRGPRGYTVRVDDGLGDNLYI